MRSTGSGPAPRPSEDLRVVGHAFGLFLVVLYLAQHVTAPPNSTEGGVVFNYVHRLAAGERVYFDLFDYYGPVSWYLPVLSYVLAGQKVIGIRLGLLAIKVVTVVLGYTLVRRLADGFHAVLGAATLTALIGLPWAFFQVPYAAHVALPLGLAAWLLVLEPRGAPSLARLIASGILTAAVVWTKVTTGAFVGAGVLFYLLYGSRAKDGAPVAPSALARAFRAGHLVVLLAYVVVFHAYMQKGMNLLFWLHLALPLLLVATWALRHVLGGWRERAPFADALRSTLVYAAVTAGATVAYLFLYFGASAGAYLRDLAASLHHLRYDRPFPPIGVPGPYRGFNEWLWPELPWLSTALFATWLGANLRRARLGLPADPDGRGPEVAGFAAMIALHGFVIYSRAGEPQLIQAILPASLAVFVFAFHVQRSLAFTPPAWFRPALATATALGLTTILTWPLPRAFDFASSDWSSPRLRLLKFHPRRVPYFTGAALPYDVLDRDVDRAARRLRELTHEGEVVLVLSDTELLTYASETLPYGGRYAPLFYLTRAGMLDREGMLALYPPEELHRLVTDPPRLLVSESTRASTLLRVLPELAVGLRRLPYRLVGKHGVIEIYERQPSPAGRR